jgi:predicted enzyme related to lactoylglutathione lyase
MEDAGDRYADYSMIADDGNPAAGVCHARGVNVGLPPIWMLHLPVGDLAVSLRRVQEGGGKIIKATQGTEGEYTNAVVQDPVGACMALVPG